MIFHHIFGVPTCSSAFWISFNCMGRFDETMLMEYMLVLICDAIFKGWLDSCNCNLQSFEKCHYYFDTWDHAIIIWVFLNMPSQLNCIMNYNICFEGALPLHLHCVHFCCFIRLHVIHLLSCIACWVYLFGIGIISRLLISDCQVSFSWASCILTLRIMSFKYVSVINHSCAGEVCLLLLDLDFNSAVLVHCRKLRQWQQLKHKGKHAAFSKGILVYVKMQLVVYLCFYVHCVS